MPRLIWSPPALRDVARLHAFLKSRNPDTAARGVRAIRRGVGLLTTHPEIGRPVDEMPPELREWLIEFGSSFYVVLYRYDGSHRDRSDVVLLAVRHAGEA